ncbi:DNA primase small subunit PriS [Haloarchaeobius sp. FL176]|uniref:DNA primase small subunit PriS n=1 Tax=Haloarchaeobius sp. FL176 TaxID=2967129 RepID=UPI00214799E9|nr:DNA primase small subunit PriS [Haloarchaeobius sp. FL176]
MNERTRRYLRGRFGDHYRGTELSPPPEPNEREWGYITWSSGGTTMIRHHSWMEVGDLRTFLTDERPRHVYFSAGRYDDPGAGSMSKKGWRGSDLVFDLDADHLPGVDPDEDSYGEMLAVCKDALLRLLDLLETDFGFEDLTVVFSGGRGYHVHVRDDGVDELDRGNRREIVDYVMANQVDFESLVNRESVAGLGLKNPTDKRSLDTTGGWGRRVHDRLLAFVDEVRELPDEEGREHLQSFEGIGAGRSKKLVEVLDDRYDELAAGNLDVHPTVVRLADIFAEETFAAETAPIDEPVTTDINRLIRLPGSLHGGTGLAVTRIPRDEVAEFDPLHDAVPETFVGNDIEVTVDEPTEVELGGGSFTVEAGTQTVPEYVGVFLMARDHAEKGKE